MTDDREPANLSMTLQSLTLHNFKNIGQARMEFSPEANCFLGNNGMGKSNLLDAIYYLSFCKSFSGMGDTMLIKRGEDFGMIQASYMRKGTEENINVGFSRGRRKSFRRGGKEYQRLSAHIGLFPLVMVSPADMALVEGNGEERRRFMDMVISQSDARYLDMLIRYRHSLEQRNRMLRDGLSDTNLYLAIESAMDLAATYISGARRQWAGRLSGIFNRYYQTIASSNEQASLRYRTQLDDPSVPFVQLLDRARTRDRMTGYTSVGPHRDDIEMILNDMPARRTASQGQAKTYTIALRLAQYEFLKDTSSMSPLLLLDDIFDKLDSSRVRNIMETVTQDTFGQIFVTDTNRKHIDEIMGLIRGNYSMWNVIDGNFFPIPANRDRT